MIKWIFCIPVILFALLSEILQYKSYIFGTGDIIDIVFYAVGILLFILLIKLKKMYYEKNN